MTDKSRELLERAWEELLDAYEGSNGERVAKEIRAYLADTNLSKTINSQEVDRSEPVQDDEPVDISDKPEPTVAAVLPNGDLASNVYEAYEAGLREGRKEQNQPEPVAWPIDPDWLWTVLRFAEKNPDCFDEVDPRFISLGSDDTNAVIAALNRHPARTKPFVRLTSDEVTEIIWAKQEDFTVLARAIEDALEEKNRG